MASRPPPMIRLLGPVSVTRGDEPVALPPSQKTRALLAYLAVTGRPQQRERLCSLFWDVTDDPRGALRWSLSKLRVLDDEDAQRIVADRQTVAFEARGATVDAAAVRAGAAHVETQPVDELRRLVALHRGDFLEGLELPDLHEFQAWRVAEREAFRRLHAQLLRALIARLAPDEALAPARELVRLEPESAASRAALIRLLGATGHREEAEEHVHLGRQRVTGDPVELERAWREVAAAPARPVDAARQEIRFCTAADGVRIAWATLGEGPPIVKTANWMTHLEYDWQSPLWRHLARELSREHRLIRYDQRGTGLSDRDVEDLSMDAHVADLAAVLDAAGLERVPLLGVSQGCRVAIVFATRHPARVQSLVLYGGSPRGWKHRNPAARDTRAGLQALIREGWGRDTPAFRQVFTTLFMPGASAEQAGWFNELQRVSTSPENAYRITEALADVDVMPLLAEVRAPTLVLHATQDAMVPFDEGRLLAAGIPGARFVALESQNHLLLDDEPAFARFLREIRAFVAQYP